MPLAAMKKRHEAVRALDVGLRYDANYAAAVEARKILCDSIARHNDVESTTVSTP